MKSGSLFFGSSFGFLCAAFSIQSPWAWGIHCLSTIGFSIRHSDCLEAGYFHIWRSVFKHGSSWTFTDSRTCMGLRELVKGVANAICTFYKMAVCPHSWCALMWRYFNVNWRMVWCLHQALLQSQVGCNHRSSSTNQICNKELFDHSILLLVCSGD